MSKSDLADKPGTALRELIPKWTHYHKKGCNCTNWADKMDAWGVKGCLKRREEITRHLCRQSDMLIPAFRAVPASVRKRIAQGLVDRAIKKASQGLSEICRIDTPE